MIKKITLLLTACFVCMQITTAQTLFSEGFEGATFPPADWASFIGTNGLGTVQDWNQVTVPNTGIYAAANVYENVTGGIAEDWLVTSQLDLTSATNTELLFYSAQSYGTNYGSTYEIKVSTSSQTTHADFTTVASYDETDIGPTDGFDLKTVDLSAYDGMMIYIAFVHFNDDGDNWIIDDVEVRSPLDLDAKVDNVTLNRYSLLSTDNQLSVDVSNNGTAAITSLDISWSDGTDNYSENFNVNITSGQTQTIDLAAQINYDSVVEKNITATISSVNGGADGDSENNSQSIKFNTLSQSGSKAVLIEEGTGTWCGWCPRGAVAMDYMISNYPDDFIGIAVHNGDPMVVTEYDDGAGISGFPGCNVDRVILGASVSQAAFLDYYNTRKDLLVPSDVTIDGSISGNELVINANATFYSNFSDANFRLGVIISENGVTGTTSGYAQTNYYSGGGQGAMGGYENLPDPVPADQMVYDHVGRALLGGYNGQEGSIPSSITDGQNVQYTFNYTVPSTSSLENMHVIAVIIDQGTGAIVNSTEVDATEALSNPEFNVNTMSIYPNPAKDVINLSFEARNSNYTVSITDMLGRTVYTQKHNDLSGMQNLSIPVKTLSNGNYILSIASGSASFSKQIIIR